MKIKIEYLEIYCIRFTIFFKRSQLFHFVNLDFTLWNLFIRLTKIQINALRCLLFSLFLVDISLKGLAENFMVVV